MTANPTCARCGEPVRPGARFCMKCGADVSGEQGAVATAMMPSADERNAMEAALEQLRRATVGEYEILHELGRGGMASVYLAHDIALDRKVAIKVMAPALLLMGEGMVERFKREARTAASLSHPNIIPIHAVKSQGRVLYFVMKFIAGRSLESIIRDVGALPIPMVQALLHQVGGALGYAHRRNIVHRDVKPANIMVDEEGWSVVTDFGIAKVAEAKGLTMTGVAVGTPAYMSPEQCAAKDITGKSDQYSLGVVAYEMLTGKQPFDADSAMAIMFAHFHEQPKPVADIRPECPAGLAGAVMRMLEKSPDARWPSMEDALAAIGGKPLTADDPTHQELVALVRKASSKKILDAVPPPPTSPVPEHHRSSAPTTPMPAPTIVAVTVSPATSSLTVGDPMQLTATPRASGGTAAGGPVSWSSSNPSVATVSASGLVTGVAVGSAVITANAGGVSGTATVTVTPVPVAVLAMTPPTGRLLPGATLKLEATALDAHQTVLTGRPVVWTSAAPTIATVDPTGLVKGIAEGTVTITATCEAVAATCAVTVLPIPVAAVAVTPAAGKLTPGGKVQLQAQPRDAQGRAIEGRQVAWSSASPGVAAVSASGLVTAVGEGSARITATCEGASGAATITVAPIPVASVALKPDTLSLTIGGGAVLTASARDAAGATLTRRAIAWTSSDPRIATVAADGRVTAIAAGKARITATCEGQVAVTAVSVAAPAPAPAPPAPQVETAVVEAATVKIPVVPATKPERAEVERRASAPPAPPLPVPAVAPAKPGTSKAMVGVVVGVLLAAAGGTWWFATQRSAPDTVVRPVDSVRLGEAASVASVVLSQPPAGIAVGRTFQLVASVRDASGAELPGRVVTWSSSDSAVAQVSAVGAVTASKEGAASITATSEGRSGTVVITVTAASAGETVPVPVAVLAIAPPPKSVEVGGTTQLSVAVKDAKGGTVQDRPVVWSSSDNKVANVSSSGLVTAVGPGSATITAGSEGKTAEVVITVKAVPVAQVAISPAAVTLPVGETQALSAATTDARGTVLTGRTVTWSSSNPKVATVSALGVVSALSPGSANIAAAAEGKSGSAAVSVPEVKVAVASVGLNAPSKALKVGETAQFTAAAKDAKGGALEGRAVTWTSSNPQVATVSNDGLVTAVGPGSADITVTGEGKSSTATVTVAKAPVTVASVVITGAHPLRPGETLQLSAAAKDAKDTPLTDRSITWTSSNSAVVKVSASGLATAAGAGTADVSASSEGKSASVSIVVAAPVVTQPNNPPANPPNPPINPPVAAASNVPRKGLSAGGFHTCGLLASGAVSCWGAGRTEAAAAGVTGASMVSVGNGFACAIGAAGVVSCWGENRFGQLGDGSTSPHNNPVAIAGGLSFTLIDAGGEHICGLAAGGKAYCWGKNDKGQLGDGSTSDRSKPSAVSGGQSFATISAGGGHTCALTSAGKAYCWGDGWSGALGYGPQGAESEPVEVKTGLHFTRISAGRGHTCAIASGGKAYCWGDNKSGQDGDGSSDDQDTPVGVSSSLTFEDISAGGSHTCALVTGGDIVCWGENRVGQLGDGTRRDHGKPAPVTGGLKFTTLAAGNSHTCGVTTDQQTVCWGGNARGQLGDGGSDPRPTPGPVTAAP